MRNLRWAFVTLLLVCCDDADRPSPRPPVNEPLESNPLRQGFTQRPSPDTPGLPPPIPPLLSEAEAVATMERFATRDARSLSNAQNEMESLVSAYETDGDSESVARLKETAVALARDGRLRYSTIEDLYSDFLFPNDVEAANREYGGRFVLLAGTVSPHNMKDFADGFKLIEQNPYIHDPLLLATDYELSFVECRLSRPFEQPLRDWQPIHFVARVAGKRQADLLLDRCVVL